MRTHIHGVRYSLPSVTDDIDRIIMQSSNERRGAKFQRVVLLPGFIQQQLRLIPFMEKKNSLRCKVNNPVRLHILLVTLHATASCENKFFSEHFMYSNARGSNYYS